MSPVEAIFVPFPLRTGTKLLHPRLPPQSLNGSKVFSVQPSIYFFAFLFNFVMKLAIWYCCYIDVKYSIAVATNSRLMIFVTIVSCVRWCVCMCVFDPIYSGASLRLSVYV